MRVVIQRVSKAKVTVDRTVVGEIGKGYLVFVGFKFGDTVEEVKRLTGKIVNLRLMADEKEDINLDLKTVGGEILVVPQFTLYAETSGRRPYFGAAEKPERAKELFNLFITELKNSGLKVEAGKFGGRMSVELTNDGPVTLILES